RPFAAHDATILPRDLAALAAKRLQSRVSLCLEKIRVPLAIPCAAPKWVNTTGSAEAGKFPPPPRHGKTMNANYRNFALWVIIFLLVLALVTLFQSPGQKAPTSEITFSQLLSD